mgnify:CR=1 FL=1
MMKRALVVVATLVSLCPVSCDPKDVQKVDTVIRDVVNAAQFACIEASVVTDSREVALACEIVKTVADATPEVLAFVEKLITRREMLRRAGYEYDKPRAAWKKP